MNNNDPVKEENFRFIVHVRSTIIFCYFYISQTNLGLTKLMVATGLTGATYLNTIEVIDLSSHPTTCDNLPNFPFAVYNLLMVY